MTEDIFLHADKALVQIYALMAKEFQSLSHQLGFDELNTLETSKRVNAMYKRLDEYIRKQFAVVAREAYRDACEECGHQPEGFDPDAFVVAMLVAYDPLSDFIYEREWTRKRDRLFESIIATERGNQEMRKNLKRGMDVLANQVRQYADNISARARIRAFRDWDADVLVWVTEKDEKVCEICAPRDEQFYPIELLPDYPAHWHCRCQLHWVDMEERRRRPPRRQ